MVLLLRHDETDSICAFVHIFVVPATNMTCSARDSVELQSLLNRAADGDDQVYAILIAEATERLRKLTRRMLRNYPALRRWEETDDVFQNAVMRLHRSLSEVRPESVRAFFGLAATQVRRTLIDLVRHHFGPHGQATHHDSDQRTGTTNSGFRLAQHQSESAEPATLDAWARFHEAVEQLPDEERSVFEMIWYAGMEQTHVAAVVGLSLSTVQRRWYRARFLLQQSMSGEWPSR